MFDRSGLMSRVVPPAAQDVPAYCRDEPFDCSTYRLLGGGFFSKPDHIETIEASSRYGILTRTNETFAHDGDGLKIGGLTYRHLPPLPKGTRLSGSWLYTYAAAGSMAMSSGGIAIQRGLSLGSDGHFSRTGWSGVSTTNESGGTTTGFTSSHKAPAQSGRYEIDGYHIILTGDDGTAETMVLFEPDGSDKLLTINGDNYLKQ